MLRLLQVLSGLPRYLLLSFFSLLHLTGAMNVQAESTITAENQVAPLSDTEARAMLIDLLSQQETAIPRTSLVSTLERYTGQFNQQLDRLSEASSQAGMLLEQTISSVLAGGGGGFGFIGLSLLFLGGGYLVERMLGYRLHSLAKGINHQASSGWVNALCLNGLRTLLDVIRIAIFFLCAILIPVLYYPQGHPTRLTLLTLISTLTLVRIGVTVSRALFAPYAKGIRALPIDSSTAQSLHRGAVTFIGIYFVTTSTVHWLSGLGYPSVLTQTLMAVVGCLLNLTIIALLWLYRSTINDLFHDSTVRHNSTQRAIFAQTWPLLITTWLFMLWFIWGFHTFVGNQELAEKVTLSWWITLLFPLADRLFFSLLSHLTTLPLFQSRSFDQRRRRFLSVIQTCLRIILICIALIAVAEAWGLGSLTMFESASSKRLLASLVDVLTISLIAYVVWELIYSLIERHLPEPAEQEADSLEGEGGAAGTTRTETLLPLLRSLLLVLLLVIVVLSVLYSLGVQIGPLLGGAGVVGIAVGFGSQKLVQDVISGVFFLWDDAFRRGEYIETGELKGTVERISIRSMQLRHHLGAVQTIPYGNIDTIKNLSRDWVTMKLEMRLPYDTDIEKVRKIVKKIGQQMLEDEELGPNMLHPLKSQGVTRMEESALIVRMKFTTKPGEQWVIRREAYRRVRDALQEAGISFAHPEVRIRMPEGGKSQSISENDAQQAVAGRLQVRKHSEETPPSDSH